ncbi:MAG: sugar ABC transporter substrate-binding protein [Clostridiales Family XIII bacterium]|jgi:ribose transport system substrate-binding protein|nr:sugar ABC transporter substrate-binding protein [Clostridiales Family XIII bacterium]
MRKKKLAVLGVAIIMTMAMILTGCGGSSDPAGSSDTGNSDSGSIQLTGKDISKETVKIAYIPMSMQGQTNELAKIAVKDVQATYPNLEIQYMEAERDAAKQNQLIAECIAQDFDAIIMEATDGEAVGPSIEQAEKAGIPVITSNVGSSALHTLHIENSSYQSGEVAAKAIIDRLGGKGNVILLDVPAEIKSVSLFGTGFEDYIAANSEIEIIGTENIPGFSQEEANTKMRALLTANKGTKIDAVFGVADEVALGAIDAINSEGRSGDGILVWGSDCIPLGIKAIKDGKLTGTNFPDQYGSVKTALNMALYFVETGVNSVSAGYETTPSIVRPFAPVDKDNVNAVEAQSHWLDIGN